MKLLVIDGNSIVNRAFYGIKLLTTKDGRYTNAVYGFMNVLLRLEDAEKPDGIAVAFDLPAPTFRHRMYGGYKAHRKGMPPELASQLPVLKELLSLLGYPQVSREGFEADDILGTLAKAAAGRGDTAVLATGDRDALQLVCAGVNVLLTSTVRGQSETLRMDEDAVKNRYGVDPPQLIEVKALMGDASDNIPGVPGVGEKTALELIQRFGTLEEVYLRLSDPFIKPGVRQKLLDGQELARLSRRLAVISCEVPIPAAVSDYRKTPADAAAAAAVLSRLEMHSMLDRLNLSPPSAPCGDGGILPCVTPTALPHSLSGMIFMAPVSDGWLAVPAGGGAVYRADPDDSAFSELICNGAAYKRVFDSKALYRAALKQNLCAASVQFDAKLAAYLLNPAAAGYGVSSLAAEYGVTPPFICEEYPAAPLLEPLFRLLAEKCRDAKMDWLLREIEQPLARVLAEMELAGIALDCCGLRAFGDELKTVLDGLLCSVYRHAGGVFNLNSPKQLAGVLFEKLGLPPGRKTKSGYSTDAETLEGLRHMHPVVDEILQYRIYQKLHSTYVEGLLKQVGGDGRIHSTFNQTEARTGRISSGEPNMQNIPVRTELGSRLRAFFTAPEGHVLADADYSQIELRILSHISQDAAMQQAFNNGEDIHRATAARVHGLPPGMVTSQMRSSAKAVNFGIVYGIGAFSLSKDIGVSVKEADAFIKNYLDSFPGVRKYMEETVAFGGEHGYVQTLFGRRRPVPELANSNRTVQALGQRIALNTPIQGTAADIIKLAMIRVSARLRAEKLAARLILQVHDELIVEAPRSEAKRVCAILRQEMENAAALSVPLSADVHTGENWLAAKE